MDWCFRWDVQSTQWFHWTGITLLYGGDLRNRHRITTVLRFTYISSFLQAIVYTSIVSIFHSSAHLARLVLVRVSREHFPDLSCFLGYLSVSFIFAFCPTFFQKHHLNLSFLLSPKPASKFLQRRYWFSAWFVCPIQHHAVEYKWILQSDTSVFKLQAYNLLVNSKIKPKNFWLSST